MSRCWLEFYRSQLPYVRNCSRSMHTNIQLKRCGVVLASRRKYLKVFAWFYCTGMSLGMSRIDFPTLNFLCLTNRVSTKSYVHIDRLRSQIKPSTHTQTNTGVYPNWRGWNHNLLFAFNFRILPFTWQNNGRNCEICTLRELFRCCQWIT